MWLAKAHPRLFDVDSQTIVKLVPINFPSFSNDLSHFWRGSPNSLKGGPPLFEQGYFFLQESLLFLEEGSLSLPKGKLCNLLFNVYKTISSIWFNHSYSVFIHGKKLISSSAEELAKRCDKVVRKVGKILLTHWWTT